MLKCGGHIAGTSTAFSCWSGSTGRGSHPQGSDERFQSCRLHLIPPSQALLGAIPSTSRRLFQYRLRKDLEACHEATWAISVGSELVRRAPRVFTQSGLCQKRDVMLRPTRRRSHRLLDSHQLFGSPIFRFASLYSIVPVQRLFPSFESVT